MAEESTLTTLRKEIKEQLEDAKRKVDSLTRAYNALSPAEEQEGEYRGMSVWLAVRQFLKRVGKSELNDIVDELTRGGCDLGKYPLRTVSISVGSKPLKNVFRVEKENGRMYVSLYEKGVPPKGTPAKSKKR